ncbi:uncharacterized protein ACLA_017960 [Aspergillus clavatus NRRL 1]|uniref:Uncharacterized protein n=1 Tax=Aspergillus clavatus (strain ATCC 1007 / CBS 513.65 / DSM 816 / NCTC 3887 / NRRL 1 / QM 1276 / 107) TaxID=344612 RepID=A1CN72_ASPCL|nr:uncharacterized protein ACLA_017960 [Aspergillus clavatus NRRL 1]EAW07093.1 conserved hypothetical protein [Aspergillus clavatus NRRL 1]
MQTPTRSIYPELPDPRYHKEIAGLAFNSTHDQVCDAWKLILEHCFPIMTTDEDEARFIHKQIDLKTEYPHLAVASPQGQWPNIPRLHVYCQAVPPPGVKIWETLERAVKFELTSAVDMIRGPKPSMYAIIAAGPLIRVCGVNKEGRFWDIFSQGEEESAWNIHTDFDTIIEALCKIRAKLLPPPCLSFFDWDASYVTDVTDVRAKIRDVSPF